MEIIKIFIADWYDVVVLLAIVIGLVFMAIAKKIDKEEKKGKGN